LISVHTPSANVARLERWVHGHRSSIVPVTGTERILLHCEGVVSLVVVCHLLPSPSLSQVGIFPAMMQPD
jgi:hypothetical protein